MILHQTSLLETLVVRLELSDYSAPPSPVPLHHVHTLKTLDKHSLDVLNDVTLPALKNLSLEDSDASHPTVLEFLARSRCELTSLMSGFGLSIMDQLLATISITTLTELRLYTRSSSVWSREEPWIPFFERLTKDQEFLPNLETLSVEWGLQVVTEEVVEMLESRWSRSSNDRLKSFELRCRLNSINQTGYAKLEVDAEFRVRLQALIADGLKIEITGM